MSDTLPTKSNRDERRRTKPVALAGAVLAVTALTAAITPPAAPSVTKLDVALAAAAEPVPQPTFGIGPLGGLITPLIDALGMNPFPLPLGLGGIAYDFSGGAPSTKGIYDLINGLAYKPLPTDGVVTCANVDQDQCRTAFVISTGYGALGTTDAIQTLISGAVGTALPVGLDPLKPATGTGLTQVSGIYLNNILRPNGGFDSRFPMLVEPFGVKTTMPATGYSGPNNDGSSVFNWITDITWPYNTLGDFPVTPSPLAIANSVFAAVPPPALINLVTSGASATDLIGFLTSTTAGTLVGTATGGQAFALPTAVQCPAECNWASLGVLNILGPVTGDPQGSDSPGIESQYLMLDAANPFIPLTTPLYVNSLVTNAVLKQFNSPYLLGTPLAVHGHVIPQG